MVFKDNFYTILSSRSEGDSDIFTVRLNKEHAIFNGHFPGNPVTPGVVQMEIVKELVSELLNKQIKLEKMPNCKFLAILNPEVDSDIDVDLKLTDTEENQYRAIVSIHNNETVFLKMSAYYSPTQQ